MTKSHVWFSLTLNSMFVCAHVAMYTYLRQNDDEYKWIDDEEEARKKRREKMEIARKR